MIAAKERERVPLTRACMQKRTATHRSNWIANPFDSSSLFIVVNLNNCISCVKSQFIKSAFQCIIVDQISFYGMQNFLIACNSRGIGVNVWRFVVKQHRLDYFLCHLLCWFLLFFHFINKCMKMKRKRVVSNK